MRISTFLILCAFGSPLLCQAGGDKFGKYDNAPVQVQFCGDGRHVRLLREFSYIDPSGAKWEAPSGSIVDGASIPNWAWSIIGGPFEGKYRDASVIHDVACVNQMRPWEYTHLAFYYAMLASGVDETKAKIMYTAVYRYGPRWQVHDSNWNAPELKTDGFQCADAIGNSSNADKRSTDVAVAQGSTKKHSKNKSSKSVHISDQENKNNALGRYEMPAEFSELKKKIEASPKSYTLEKLRDEANSLP